MTYQNPTYCQNLSVAFSHNTFFGEIQKNENSRNLRLDYYLFGMPMPSRTFTGNGYRFGFNGQEKENEIYGEGNTYSAEYWMYDSRLGRRWNLDPVDQISISNYATFANNPIANVDPKGDKYIAKSKSDQNTTMSYLNSVLGEGHGYKFNKKGELKYSRLRDRNKRNYTEDQLFIHEGLKEVVKNKDRIIEGKFYDSNADVKVDFKALDIVTDASGRIMMNNGEPVLELQTVETVEITNAASGGGGVFVNSFDATGNPYDNAALFVFQLDAVEATYESDDESRYQFNNAAPVFFHELLDHGLDYVRTGNTNASSSSARSSVKYQNKVLNILEKPLRKSHTP